MAFSLFWDTLSMPSILPSGGPIGGTSGPKNQLYVKSQQLSNHKTDFRSILDRVRQDLKLSQTVSEDNPLRMTLEPIFQNLRQISCFYINYYQYFTIRGTH